MKRGGLPSPIKQFRVRLPGGWLRRYDLVYPAHRIAIETDGYRFHRFKADWQRDLDDINQLFEIGWRLLRFSWADLSERSDHVIDTVRRPCRIRIHNCIFNSGRQAIRNRTR